MRKLLLIYRRILFWVCERKWYGVMNKGESVCIEQFHADENHGDVVHPCVRYIADGFEGHYWWMVYTPYYKADAAIENPILCYANGNDPNTPPIEWKHYCLVNEKPLNGYNSDPTLFYHEKQLYVLWRENYTYKARPYYRATFIARVMKGNVERMADPVLVTYDSEIDNETCPCFMPDKNGTIMAYGMHLRFHSKHIKSLWPLLQKIANRMVSITDLLGLYSQQKHYGLAIWRQNNTFLEPFIYEKTVKFDNCNGLYKPWHMDFFDYCNQRYAIVQTNQCNADICLAVSNDNIHFSFYKKPLITNATIGKAGIYKPCAGVTKDGTFFLYYTAQDINNRSLNKLYLTKMNFAVLIEKIK